MNWLISLIHHELSLSIGLRRMLRYGLTVKQILTRALLVILPFTVRVIFKPAVASSIAVYRRLVDLLKIGN
jgi:hypothetical protein